MSAPRQKRSAAALAALLLPLAFAACSQSASSEDEQPTGPAATGLHTMTSDGVERSYYLDLPTDYDADAEPKPLILAMHGTGGSHEKWLDDSYNLKESVGDGAVMVYPNALPSAAGTNQWSIATDLPFFADLLDHLPDRVTYDPERVFVTGQSSGAGMSHEIGCAYGDRVRAIAPAAGVLTATECVGSVAVLQMQGLSDPVVPFSLAQQTGTFWTRYNGLDPDVSKPATHPNCITHAEDDTNPYPVLLCTHNEGAGDGRKGHAWPSIAGPAIWEFFSSLPRTSPTTEAPAGGGNEKTQVEASTTATFKVRFPDKLPSTPTVGAVVVYAKGNITPTTAPLAFMTMQFAPGAVSPGEVREYEVPVKYTLFGSPDGFTIPGDYTVMVTMHTEDGGYPIPVPGVDMMALFDWSFTSESDPITAPDVLVMAPIPAGTGL